MSENGRIAGNTAKVVGELGRLRPKRRIVGARPDAGDLSLDLWPVSQPHRQNAAVSHFPPWFLRCRQVQALYGHRFRDQEPRLPRRPQFPPGKNRKVNKFRFFLDICFGVCFLRKCEKVKA